jgi:hypothetical protein
MPPETFSNLTPISPRYLLLLRNSMLQKTAAAKNDLVRKKQSDLLYNSE